MPGPAAVVVGTGFGCRVHVPALRAAGFEVVALVGRDADRTARRAERLGVEHTCTSLDEALARPGVAAVTIATPPATHHDLVLASAAAGVAVLSEKPFALNAVEAASMVAAADRASVPALVGHEFRWAPDRAVVARAIAAGAIGEPRLVTLVSHVALVADPTFAMPPWWFDRAAGGGWLLASGSHLVDQVRVWLGEFESVSAALPSVGDRQSGLAEDSFSIRFRLASGVEGVLQQTGGAWGQMNGLTAVAGTKGTVGIDSDGPWIADAAGRRALPVDRDLAFWAAPSQPPAPERGTERYTHLEVGPYTRLCEALREMVEGREPASAVPVPTFSDGLACMRVLDAARASAASGGTLVTVAS